VRVLCVLESVLSHLRTTMLSMSPFSERASRVVVRRPLLSQCSSHHAPTIVECRIGYPIVIGLLLEQLIVLTTIQLEVSGDEKCSSVDTRWNNFRNICYTKVLNLRRKAPNQAFRLERKEVYIFRNQKLSFNSPRK
jgi:hypothetical protein